MFPPHLDQHQGYRNYAAIPTSHDRGKYNTTFNQQTYRIASHHIHVYTSIEVLTHYIVLSFRLSSSMMPVLNQNLICFYSPYEMPRKLHEQGYHFFPLLYIDFSTPLLHLIRRKFLSSLMPFSPLPHSFFSLLLPILQMHIC